MNMRYLCMYVCLLPKLKGFYDISTSFYLFFDGSEALLENQITKTKRSRLS